MRRLSGWGRFPSHEARVSAPRDAGELAALLAEGPAIARGAGRAYGDSAIAPANTIDMRHFDRMAAFDAETGILEAEAGVTLADVIETFLPRGWFPRVAPGTRFVTLGGAIAADVHGKNHHKEGGFRETVEWVEVMGADGATIRASRTENPELFDWTLGGMGLTGVVTRAAIRLRPVESGWIRQRAIPFADLDAGFETLATHDEATYSVAWIDCLAGGRRLGRGIALLGEHARADELPPKRRATPFAPPRRRPWRVPFDAPSSLLNRFSIGAFNRLYHAAHAVGPDEALVGWEKFFFPLDAILGWNRIYGRRGFLQFQCVLPEAGARAGLRALLEATSAAGQGSFLAVLKRLGDRPGAFSFPMGGYTLALDFPVSRQSLALMDRLDRITLDHGGRFYLAKDARLSAETLRAADPRAERFAALREEAGWRPAFGSAQSERLKL